MMTMILHVVIMYTLQCVSQHVSKVLLTSIISMLFIRRKKSRKSMPEVLSMHKDAVCEVAIFQLDCHRQHTKKS